MELVGQEENLARFILQKRHIRADNTVKYAAFFPNKNGETSVFRVSGITDNKIWSIGERDVASEQGRQILGRADIKASIVISKELNIIPNEPPELHANITGWPDERSKQKEIALELASDAQFHRR